MGHLEHKKDERARKSLDVFVITLSDTRTGDDDESGKLITFLLEEAGHNISGYSIIKDDVKELEDLVVGLCVGSSNTDITRVDAIVINGGTGISFKDITYDTLRGLYDKELPGFGELFRSLSYETIGSSSIMSRASAGIYNGRIIFSIPGSVNAVKLAMEKIIIGEIGHLYYELSKHVS